MKVIAVLVALLVAAVGAGAYGLWTLEIPQDQVHVHYDVPSIGPCPICPVPVACNVTVQAPEDGPLYTSELVELTVEHELRELWPATERQIEATYTGNHVWRVHVKFIDKGMARHREYVFNEYVGTLGAQR